MHFSAAILLSILLTYTTNNTLAEQIPPTLRVGGCPNCIPTHLQITETVEEFEKGKLDSNKLCKPEFEKFGRVPKGCEPYKDGNRGSFKPLRL
jgi:hypothetical protein